MNEEQWKKIYGQINRRVPGHSDVVSNAHRSGILRLYDEAKEKNDPWLMIEGLLNRM